MLSIVGGVSAVSLSRKQPPADDGVSLICGTGTNESAVGRQLKFQLQEIRFGIKSN